MIRYGRNHSVGSKATSPAINNAKSTGLGSKNRTVTTSGGAHQGNIAGFKNEKPVRLEHRAGGYSHPANQIARLGPKQNILSNSPQINNSPSARSNNKSSILDQRLCKSKSSSISKLTKLR